VALLDPKAFKVDREHVDHEVPQDEEACKVQRAQPAPEVLLVPRRLL
jgi:hypothetical protein